MIFLGKKGRAYGPYQPDEVEKLRASGELQEFHWMWNANQKHWEPLDPPPPPIEQTTTSTEQAKGVTKKVTPKVLRHDAPLALEVICHNSRTAVSGRLQRVSESSGELIIEQKTTVPPFGDRTQVRLSVLDTSTGEIEDFAGMLSEIQRIEGHWVFHVRWNDCPELVLQSG